MLQGALEDSLQLHAVDRGACILALHEGLTGQHGASDSCIITNFVMAVRMLWSVDVPE